MSLHAHIPQITKMLGNIGKWLEEAEKFAESRGFDADVLLDARLFPDMPSLGRNLQMVSDTAKFFGSRLTGVEAPKDPDTETTMAEFKNRLAGTTAFLEGIDPAAFDNAETRDVYLNFLKGGYVTGDDYVTEWGLPNFYFHVTAVYAILRNNVVKLGKRAFIGGMNVKMPSA